MLNKLKINKMLNGDPAVKLSPLVMLLSLISIAYGNIIRFRYALFSWGIFKKKRLPCFVISIGNITAGGTGKTPMTIYVAGMIKRLGYSVAVISRGYKGGAEHTGGIVSDGHKLQMDVNDGGDEPVLMAVRLHHVPVLVGKRRFQMGLLAKNTFHSDIIVLDDAFQHVKLRRDLDIVLLDSKRPLGNGYLLPRGMLREPVSGLKRGDVYILTRYDEQTDTCLEKQKIVSDYHLQDVISNTPVFKTCHTPYYFKVNKGTLCPLEDMLHTHVSFDFTLLKHRKVYTFSGIAGNHHFKRTVRGIPCDISGCLDFPDHYRYSSADISDILRNAQTLNVDAIITTDKDFMRISNFLPLPVDLVVIGVNICFEDEEAFESFITDKLKGIGRNNMHRHDD